MAAPRVEGRPRPAIVVAVLGLAAFLAVSIPARALAAGNTALQFDGVGQAVTFGTASGLNASTFTLEAWIKWTGGGDTVSTGSGGLTAAIPILTKGRGEAEASNVDMNYFLGLNGGKLAVDYEEGTGQTSPGLNHPLTATTTVTPNVWHHAAATFDGTTLRLYLDGVLDGTLVVGTTRLPQSVSIQHAGIATAMTSTGARDGFFAGVIDEVRVWGTARTEAQIQAARSTPINPQAGLLGAWHLDEGGGATAGDATPAGTTGTLVGGPPWVTGFDVTNAAVQLNGSNQYITMGAAPALGVTQFTLETWFKRTGAGVGTSTGAGGIASAVPLLTKGRAEAETPANLNMNWFLGIDVATSTLVADFEDTAGGINHPVLGTTGITSDTWHHAAATWDGTTWRLYLDGTLDKTLVVGAFTPQSASIQHAAIGTALTSAPAAAGFFAGSIDEARVWSTVRNEGQIQAAKNVEIAPQAGLVGAWHLNEGSGTSAVNSAAAGTNGTLTGGPAWIDGFVPPSLAPTSPVLSAPSDGATGVATSPTLDVIASDPDGGDLDVSFFGRPLASGTFVLIGTQIDVPSGTHAIQSWAGRGGGQTYEWYAEASDGTVSTTSPTWTFHTVAGVGTAVTGVGDIASCTSTGDEATAAIMAGLDGPIFTTGDNVYQSGLAQEYLDCFEPSWGPFKSRIRPVPGNHDWGNTTPGSLAGYNGYFGANATDAGGKSYYSYDIDADWHVVNLDSECQNVPGGCAAGSPQHAWLVADLAANADQNVMAVWHKPRFSSGTTNLVAMQALVDALYVAGVDLALVGHDHIYERFQPLDSRGEPDPLFGIRHLTVGTGGAEHHAAGAQKPTSEALDDETYGVLRLVLRPTGYDWSFLPVDGETFTDSGSGTVHDAPPGPGENGLDLGSQGGYVTFGDPAKLDLAQFTVETWFKRTGTGVAGSTGTGGLTLVPLVTHGGPQAEGSNLDGDWILGIEAATGFLAADFEDAATGANHPVVGTTAVTNDVWHHAAATYDGTAWRLYLDGQLEVTKVENASPRADTIQHAGLGVMLLSTGLPANTARFDGVLDEARVWGAARSLGQIRSTANTQIEAPASGLVARWGLDEGSVPTVDDTIAPLATGSLVGPGITRVAGAPFDLPIDTTAPAAPGGLGATAGDGTVELAWTANVEPDLDGYRVYRSTSTPVVLGTPLNSALLTSPAYTDASVSNGTTYHYAVTAVDDSGNESVASAEANATPVAPPELQTSLDLGGSGAYVTFGDASELGLPAFTLETWFKRIGAGVAGTTGTEGIAAFIPLVTHGGPEAEGSSVDANWLLGIDDATDVLAADFEEGAAGATPGRNHPVRGVTPIALDVWHHAAATYDGTTWRLYLDGQLEASLVVGQPARADSAQHAALGAMLLSSGAPASPARFQGVLDEVRVWSGARSETQIRVAIHLPPASSTGLVARWGMGDAPGATVGDSTAPDTDGTIVGPGVTRPADAPFGAPTVHAGPDRTVTLPASGLLDGTALDDGVPDTLTTLWTQVAGSDSAVIAQPSQPSTSVSFGGSGTGIYTFRLTASDGATSTFDDVTITVLDPGPAPDTGLDFDGANDHVTFGDAAALRLSQFTIETWFRRDAAGVSTGTGSGGISAAIPLVTKGRNEVDGTSADMNWFLGIDATSAVLVADFEEGAGGATPGLNHPISGVTPIETGVWYHAAATYDGNTWRLYLNGILDQSLTVGQPVRSDSIQHAGLATAMNSAGTPVGAFAGVLDETRVWSLVRTQGQIEASMGGPLATAPGLVARWGMDEGSGPSIASSAGTPVSGTLVNGPLWVAGTPFVSTANQPPSTPTLVAPSDGATGVSTSPTLQVGVSDPNGGPLNTSFFGRTAGPPPAQDFTIVVLPDTQHYVDADDARAAIYRQQTQWIVDNAAALNVVFVSHLGDITENFDTVELEWQRADTAMQTLDNAGIPNNLAPGNHDLGTGGTTSNYYDQYFPPSRYNLPANGWYGGWLGEEAGQVQRLNKDNYELFTAGGVDFLIVHLEIDMPTFAVQWADEIIDRYPDRQVILSTHAFLNTSNARPTSRVTARADGQSAATVWTNLVAPNCNVFMVVNGHYPGEGRLTSTNDCGRPVHQVLTDYQSRTNGGDGWLRYYTFRPSEDRIDAFTYSPRLGAFETDASSQFSLAYALGDLGGFDLIGSVNAASGSTASIQWPDREGMTGYEWYAVTTDGTGTRTSPTWTFTTGAAPTNNPPIVTNPGPQTTAEGVAVDLAIEATDPDGHTLAYSATGLPPGLSISATTGHITGAPSFTAAAGSPYTVIVSVADGHGPPVPVEFSWTITNVNNEPTFDQDLGDRTDAEGTLVSLDAGATDLDGDALTYAASNLPPGLSINTGTGLITGTIGSTAAPGPYAVSVTVRDGPTVDATDTFSWSVTDVPPGAGIALRSVTYGSNDSEALASISLARPAGVVAGDVLLASIDTRGSSVVTGPAGWTLVRMDINGTSLRKSTYVRLATGSEPASYSWTFSAARLAAGAIHAYSGVDPSSPIDASGGALGASSTAVVAPSITTTVPGTLLVGFFANQTNATWTPPAGMTERGERIGTGPSKTTSLEGADQAAPSAGPTGTRTASASKAAASVAHLIALRPASGGPPPPNNEPTFDQDLGDRTDAEGTLVSLDAGATDPDGDALTYAASNLPPGLSISTTTGLITGTIGSTAAPGPYAVSVTVRDGPTVDATDTFSWSVTDAPPPPNNEPTFDQDLGDRTDAEGTLVSLDAGATDLDGDALTYAASNLPPGLSINTGTGLITGTIGSTAAPGPYAVSVTVRDGPTVDATDTFSWSVTDVPPGAGIALRSVTYGSNDSEALASISLARPAGVVAGDVLLASIDTRGSSVVTGPAGWTLVRMDINGTSLRKSTYVRLATGSEPASYSWTFSAARLAAGAIHAYSGVDPSSPIDASGGALGASSTAVVAPSITTTVPGTLLVGFFANQTNATWTPPAGMTERGERIGTGPSKTTSLEGADQAAPSAGPTGTRTASASKAAASVAHLIALRPASGGPPPPNNEPTFDQDLGDRTDAEGTLVSLDAGATDLDGDALTYAASNLPPGLSINTGTGLITGTIGSTAAPGPYAVSVTVRDGPTVDATDTFSWSVTDAPPPPNNEPTFDQDLGDRTDAEGTLVSLDAGATDLDGDALTYAASNLPPGLSINTGTGLITGTIGSTAAPGPYAVSVTVRDGPTVDATDTFSWSVTDVPPGAGIALRSVTYGSNDSEALASISLARPAGVVAGDVLLASIDTRGSSVVTGPAGWTLVRMDINGTSLRKSTYVRLATGSEPASYSWTFSAARLAAGAIHAYSGVDPSSPIDASGGALGASSTAVVAPSITTTVPGTLLVGFFANQTNATWTPPAGMTERGERIGTGPSKTTSLEGADQAAPSAGPTGTRTASASKAAASVAHLIALRPASGGP